MTVKSTTLEDKRFTRNSTFHDCIAGPVQAEIMGPLANRMMKKFTPYELLKN